MLGTGDAIPNVELWTGPREHASLSALAGGAPTLLLFYLFDWSST